MCENHSEQKLEGDNTCREGEDKYSLLINQMLTGYALHEIICNDQGQPIDYRFLEVNPAFERITGLKSESVIGRTALEVMPDIEMDWIEKSGKVVLTGEPIHFDTFSSQFNRHFDVIAFSAAPNQFACFVTDITERKQVELYRNLSVEVLAILNESADLKDLIQRILATIKRSTACDAVGMRLQSGEDFPYFLQNGFSDDFLLLENTLVERDPNGGICRNQDGTVCLECTCGLVISGKTDPSSHLFSKGGSFWTNDALPLLDIPAEDEPRHNPRNECIHKGYASVALVPIRRNESIVGLLQINSHKNDLFTLDAIHALEGIASHIGEVMMRKQAEDTLRNNDARHSAMIANIGDVIGIVGADGIIKYKSPNIERWFGWKPGDLINTDGWETVHPEDTERIQKEFYALIEKDNALTTVEYRYKCKDGAYKWIELTAVNRINDIAINGVLLNYHDITERKRQEDILQESENQKNAILNGITANVALVDKDLKMLWVNKAAADSVKKLPEEMLGHTCHHFWANPDKPCDQCPSLKAFQTKKPERTIMHTPDGRVWDESGEPVCDANGNVIAVVEVAQDVTERYQAELALATEKERLAVTLRSIGDGVITTDTNGNIVMLNNVAEELTGWNSDEATGLPSSKVFNIINEQTRQRCENPVEKVLATGAVVGLENHTCLITKDGREIAISDSGAPIRDNESRIIGVVLVFRDMTEKRKLEDAMQRAQKLESIGLLAGGIAHDFNNVLTGIFTNLLLAKEAISKDHSAFELLERSEQSMDRATRLTSQLLTFAKGGNPVRESIYIGHLVKETARFDLSGSNVKPIFEVPKDLWMASVDRGQIQQVFSNIIINADQAMPNGGCLHISIENVDLAEKAIPGLSKGKYVKLAIRDEGIGIDNKFIDKIFDPYFTTKQIGSGLGLATAYSIINKHDGRINVDSEMGKGTTFTLYLPASESDQNQKIKHTALNEDSENRKNARVLVMDDEEMILNTAKLILERAGYLVATATDGEKAIIMYQESIDEGKPFDALIMDLTIPGSIGGKEAVVDVLKINPEAKCIVSSGYANDPIMANYSEYGFKGIIPKPYTPDKLRKAIGEIFVESAQ